MLSIACLLVAVSAFAGRPSGLSLGAGYSTRFLTAHTDMEEIGLPRTMYGAFIQVGYETQFSKTHQITVAAKLGLDLHGKVRTGVNNPRVGPTVVGEAYWLTSAFSIDIPLRYQVSFPVSAGSRMFFHVGPTFQSWLSYDYSWVLRGTNGKAEASTSGGGSWFKEDNDNIFNRVNIAVGGGFGFLIKEHFKITAGYDFGCIPVVKKGYADVRGYEQQVCVQFNYVF